jgi:hypothetical protein
MMLSTSMTRLQIAHRVKAELPSHLFEASLARWPLYSVPKNGRSIWRPWPPMEAIRPAKVALLSLDTLARHNQ